MRLFYSDRTAPHGAEVWNLKLQKTYWDPIAMTTLGIYSGTSTINGFTWPNAFAKMHCDVGYTIFQSRHP